MLGSQYLIDHCVAVLEERNHHYIFEHYIANALKCLNETVAKKYGGSYVSSWLSDLFEPKKEETETDGNKVAIDVIKKLKLQFKGDTKNGRSNGLNCEVRS